MIGIDHDRATIRDDVSLAGSCVILPIRHHSPLAAWHVRRVIESLKPDAVLVEGPEDADPLIPMLLHVETKPPIALFAHLSARSVDQEVRGFFYPFCEYSPEYVALRAAHALDIHASFIDIPTWRAATLSDDAPRVNAYADGHLRHLEFIDALCKKCRARDFDELWDSLFESRPGDEPSDQFFTSIATFCHAARQHSNPERLVADGTLLREQHMAGRIRVELDKGLRVVAVVGGFHRVGILEYLTSQAAPPLAMSKPEGSALYLTIYGYPQLDAWSGYQAGMPAPEFQHGRWTRLNRPPEAATTASIVSDVAHSMRRRGHAASTSDTISASALLEGIARLRGHGQPTLADLRDAVTASWIGGSIDEAEGALLESFEEVVVGDRTGRVPDASGRPPLVEDFHQQLSRHQFLRRGEALAQKRERQVSLDLYRRPAHRRKSAFLHRLVEINCGFATLEAGPDFVRRENLDRVRESWFLHWTPRVEQELIEASVHGSTVAEAAESILQRRSQPGVAPRGSSAAVARLTSALVMDFPHLAQDFLDSTRRAILEEGDFAEAAQSTARLVHLYRYRRVLGASKHPGFEELAGISLNRALWLLDTLPGLPADAGAVPGSTVSPTEAALDALIVLRHVAASGAIEGFNPRDLSEALARIRHRLGGLPLLEGAVLGILRHDGLIGDGDVAAAFMACMENTAAGSDPPLGDYLRGLFTARRHAISEETGLFEAINSVVGQIDAELFLRALPSLRLAFSVFSPRELKQLIQKVDARLDAAPSSPVPIPVARDLEIVQHIEADVQKVLDLYLKERAVPHLDATAGGGIGTA